MHERAVEKEGIFDVLVPIATLEISQKIVQNNTLFYLFITIQDKNAAFVSTTCLSIIKYSVTEKIGRKVKKFIYNRLMQFNIIIRYGIEKKNFKFVPISFFEPRKKQLTIIYIIHLKSKLFDTTCFMHSVYIEDVTYMIHFNEYDIYLIHLKSKFQCLLCAVYVTIKENYKVTKCSLKTDNKKGTLHFLTTYKISCGCLNIKFNYSTIFGEGDWATVALSSDTWLATASIDTLSNTQRYFLDLVMYFLNIIRFGFFDPVFRSCLARLLKIFSLKLIFTRQMKSQHIL
ncbi:hypothetical protein ACJX0J_030552, partial [Zea mays]